MVITPWVADLFQGMKQIEEAQKQLKKKTELEVDNLISEVTEINGQIAECNSDLTNLYAARERKALQIFENKEIRPLIVVSILSLHEEMQKKLKTEEEVMRKIASLDPEVKMAGSSTYSVRVLSLSLQIQNYFDDMAKLQKEMDVTSRKITALEYVMDQFSKKTENEKNPVGFVYRVTNKRGVSSFLVGTIHTATDSMSKQPVIDFAISSSKKVILETDSKILFSFYRLRRWLSRNPYRNSIDLSIIDQSRVKKIPVTGFETLMGQNKAIIIANYGSVTKCISSLFNMAGGYFKSQTKLAAQCVVNEMKESYKRTPYQNFMRGVTLGFTPAKWFLHKGFQVRDTVLYGNSSSTERMKKAVVHRIWQEGDLNMARVLGNTLPPEIMERRSKNWLEDKKLGIVKQLSTTQEPLCYAVGAAHLFAGDPNILGTLKKEESLTIEVGKWNPFSGQIEWRLT